MKFTRRHFLLGASTFGTNLLLQAGCSSPNTTSTSVVVSPSSMPRETAAGTSNLRLGFSAWPGWFPWEVAREKRLLPSGTDLKWYDNYTESISQLVGGQIDANSQTLGDTVAAVANGADLVVVLVNDYSTGNDKIICNGSIMSIPDLKGKTVAVEEGTVDHFLLLQGMQAHGLKAEDVTILPLETSRAVRAFNSGRADAVGCFAPFTTAALKKPGSRELFSSKDYPGSITDLLVFNRSFVEQNQGKVQELVTAWYRTLKFIETNNPDSLSVMAQKAGVSIDEYKGYAAGTKIFTRSDNLTAFEIGNSMDHLNHAAKGMATFLKNGNMIKNMPDLSKLFDDRFIKVAQE